MVTCDGASGSDGRSLGLGCDVGLGLSVPVRHAELLFGVSSPIHWVTTPGDDRTDLYVPVAPYGGVGVHVTRRLDVFAVGQLGTVVHVPGTRRALTDAFARLWGGLEVAL